MIDAVQHESMGEDALARRVLAVVVLTVILVVAAVAVGLAVIW